MVISLTIVDKDAPCLTLYALFAVSPSVFLACFGCAQLHETRGSLEHGCDRTSPCVMLHALLQLGFTVFTLQGMCGFQQVLNVAHVLPEGRLGVEGVVL